MNVLVFTLLVVLAGVECARNEVKRGRVYPGGILHPAKNSTLQGYPPLGGWKEENDNCEDPCDSSEDPCECGKTGDYCYYAEESSGFERGTMQIVTNLQNGLTGCLNSVSVFVTGTGNTSWKEDVTFVCCDNANNNDTNCGKPYKAPGSNTSSCPTTNNILLGNDTQYSIGCCKYSTSD